ncbi:hypothetical protein CP8484711_0617A, partial [Chlamydia psittaci 84-8471/1]
MCAVSIFDCHVVVVIA